MLENKCPLEEFYSLKEIYRSAGENENLRKCLDLLRETHFSDNSSFIQWWYDQNGSLAKRRGRSPDQFCKEGKQSELECKLMDALLGSGGG